MQTKIACVQRQSTLGYKRANLKKVLAKIDEVMKDDSVQLINFPELLYMILARIQRVRMYLVRGVVFSKGV